jgi:transposase
MVATALVALFHIATSRGGKVARTLSGEDFTGFLVTDRWSGYAWYDAGLRQVCWAHLTRDFQGFIDRGGKGARLGEKLMRQRNLFFTWYHCVRDGTMTRQDFEKNMPEVEREVGQLLSRAAAR